MPPWRSAPRFFTSGWVAGCLADFDATAETALFVGNVHVTQDRNVLDGTRLFVDRKTGKSRLESPAEGGQAAGRIAALFYQAASKEGVQAKPKPGAEVQAAQAAMFGSFKSDPNAPMEIEADTLDVHDPSRRRVVARRELHVRAEVEVRELLEELRPAALGDSGRPVHHEVLLQSGRLDLTALDRQRDPRVALEVSDLLSSTEVCEHNLVAIESHPDDRNLRRSVRIDRYQVREAP